MNNDQSKKDELITVIEDTGESLDDFVYDEKEEEEADVTAREAEGEEHPIEEREPAEDTALQQELESYREKYIRTIAELENFKKRSRKDMDEHVRYALGNFFSEFLPIIDNFHRSVLIEETDLESFREGVTLILRQIDQLLEKFGVREVEVRPGDPFDPLYQEAVSTELSPDVSHPTIGEVFQKGYLLNERLLRPVFVKVLMPVPEEEGNKNGESSGN